MLPLRVALGVWALRTWMICCLAGNGLAAGYRVENFAGAGAGGDEGPVAAARFQALEGVAAGLDGSVYLAVRWKTGYGGSIQGALSMHSRRERGCETPMASR